ncbi:cytochrome c biogenesis CcdA family protein [Thermohalobacter berrensis]|uniref:Cytochrome C biogenesis protein transmembrane domain-containing protein n=1 Tax=Thermohalobacter berrensis TaxID=99594 RepID=A0A419T1D0_9FIRM|nr:cytochrome c biogenesis protein CcdA [Thermohalobacter berrensis]RKD31228.1 hypothetical protein BET03_03620 [Thermohalobacter berrensis]
MEQYIHIIKNIIDVNSPFNFVLAFGIGFISSINPHMLSMVPMFIGYIVQENIQDRRKLLLKTAGFSIFFAIILTILGLIMYVVGHSLHILMKLSYIVASIIYIILGFKLLGIRLFKNRKLIEIYFIGGYKKRKIFSPVYILFTLVFTPCSLPFIISILTITLFKNSIIYSLLTIFLFGIGHSLIFIIAGVSSTLFTKIQNKSIIGFYLKKVFGAILLVLALVMLTLGSNH